MIAPKQFAASTMQLLQADPRAYRNFGEFWYFVKALLKQYYTPDNLFLLGDYEDPTVIARMPALDAMDTLAAAINTYRQNAAYNLGRNTVEDDAGETFTLIDPDAGGW